MSRARALTWCLIAALALGSGVTFTACDRDEGPLEEVGEDLDDAAEEVGDAVEDTADEAEDAVEDAGDEVEDATDDLG